MMYKNHKVLIIILMILICSLLLALQSPKIVSASNPFPLQTTPNPNDDIELKNALAAHLNSNINNLSINILENTGFHARGSVDNGYFIAAKVNGIWQIVADGQAMPDCQALIQYNFPSGMIPECPNLDTGTQIQFLPGGTFGFKQGVITTNTPIIYTLNTLANQTMMISVSSPNNDVYLGITGLFSGTQLVSYKDQITSWTGILPNQEAYEILLLTANPQTDFFLSVEIPANIYFNKGEYSTAFEGHIENYESSEKYDIFNHVTYYLYAAEGQIMDIQLFSPMIENLTLVVFGENDHQAPQTPRVKYTTYHAKLPLTQGYYISVYNNGPSTDFSMKISIK